MAQLLDVRKESFGTAFLWEVAEFNTPQGERGKDIVTIYTLFDGLEVFTLNTYHYTSEGFLIEDKIFTEKCREELSSNGLLSPLLSSLKEGKVHHQVEDLYVRHPVGEDHQFISIKALLEDMPYYSKDLLLRIV